MGLHHHHHSGPAPGLGADPELVNVHAGLNLRVARLSVLTAAVLGLSKLGAVVMTGSLSIAAALMDSFMDLIASTVNMFAVRFAGRPADEEHRYGHGKAEGLAGLVQGIVVGFTGLFLLFEGTRRLITQEAPIAFTEVGIGVMVLSLVGSAWIGWLLTRTAKKTQSVALKADAAHYTSDVWMNLGVLVALVVIQLTEWTWIDGAVACFVSLIVLHAALKVMRHAVAELMDTGLPDEEQQRILAAIREQVPDAKEVHRFRTRRSGPTCFVELHVSFDRDLSFVKAHRLSEEVRAAVAGAVEGAEVHVHADPYPYLESDGVAGGPCPEQ